MRRGIVERNVEENEKLNGFHQHHTEHVNVFIIKILKGEKTCNMQQTTALLCEQSEDGDYKSEEKRNVLVSLFKRKARN